MPNCLILMQVITKVAKGTTEDVDWAVDCAHVSLFRIGYLNGYVYGIQ